MSEMSFSEREDYIATARSRAETEAEEARRLVMGNTILMALAERAKPGEDETALDAQTLIDLTGADSREDAVLRLWGIIGSIRTASRGRFRQARTANESADWLSDSTAA